MRIYSNPTASIVTRVLIPLALAIVGFAAIPATAAAAPPVRETAVFSNAGAAHNECVGTLCTSTSVFVSSSSVFPAQACVDIQRYLMPVPGLFTPLGFETGCAAIAEGAFSIDDAKTLAGATLAPTSVTLDAFACDETTCQPTGTSRVVSVSATYIGVGGINTFRGNSKATFGGCTMFFGGRGTSRQATAILTIEGSSLEAMGLLSTSTQKSKVICH